ncbi:hypothetical protein Y033_3688 [Burkholderia pseudomallei MSHR435]|nr:hypothetical protein Y034_3817 [Burkholderia pseudomallei MSHR449]KGX77845.1 hypothetical protein Y033_3688 [Burkholderia pseudomallei MSHR435]
MSVLPFRTICVSSADRPIQLVVEPGVTPPAHEPMPVVQGEVSEGLAP